MPRSPAWSTPQCCNRPIRAAGRRRWTRRGRGRSRASPTSSGCRKASALSAPASRPPRPPRILLKVTWSDAPGAHHDSEKALEEFAAIGRDKSREGVPYEGVGDAKAAMRGAVKVYRGEYRTRYLYHAQMEPMNATAAVSPDGKSVEIWTGTQGPTSLHNQVAKLLGVERSNITLHQHFLGGGYG